jgi:hypothetical protein
MVLFTFAALLSESPVENNAPTETEHTSLQQDSDATSKDTSSGDSNVSYAAPPESDKSDSVTEREKGENPKSEDRSIDDSTSTSDIVQFSDTIQEEIEDNTLSDVEVTYNEYYRVLVVKLIKEQSLSPESFRRAMFLDTMDVMVIAVEHKDLIDEVQITGWANMIGTDGNSELMKVYKADRSMPGADSINWENLKGYPYMLEAIDNNFDSVYWHPGVLK